MGLFDRVASTTVVESTTAIKKAEKLKLPIVDVIIIKIEAWNRVIVQTVDGRLFSISDSNKNYEFDSYPNYTSYYNWRLNRLFDGGYVMPFNEVTRENYSVFRPKNKLRGYLQKDKDGVERFNPTRLFPYGSIPVSDKGGDKYDK